MVVCNHPLNTEKRKKQLCCLLCSNCCYCVEFFLQEVRECKCSCTCSTKGLKEEGNISMFNENKSCWTYGVLNHPCQLTTCYHYHIMNFFLNYKKMLNDQLFYQNGTGNCFWLVWKTRVSYIPNSYRICKPAIMFTMFTPELYFKTVGLHQNQCTLWIKVKTGPISSHWF